MSRETQTFARGETIVVELDATSGDETAVTEVTAKLRRLATGQWRLDATAALAATATVTTRAEAGAVPAGWTVTIPAAVSATLDAGQYQLDARLEIGSTVETTDPLFIVITEPATVTDGAGVP